MHMILTAAELVDLTGKQRPSAQRRALDRMAINYLVRPDGRVIVTASALESSGGATLKPDQPNWTALSSA